jgi:hypothetical protein
MVVPVPAFDGLRGEFKPPGVLGRLPQTQRVVRSVGGGSGRAGFVAGVGDGNASRRGGWEEKFLFIAAAFGKLRGNAAP